MLRQIKREKGFTLIELIMVIVILAIIAVVAIPKYADLSANAKENALKGTLGTIRSALSVKYSENALSGSAGFPASITGALFADGDIPKNSINNLATIKASSNNPIVSGDLDDATGWVYNSTTGEVRANTTGNDSGGTAYLTY